MTAPPVTVTLWPELRRALIALPAPCGAFADKGRLMRAVFAVCGKDCIIATDISQHLHGMALCHPSAAAAWRAELHLPPPADSPPTADEVQP